MNKKAFTIVEILIVIVVISILSTLLFRTLWDMMRSNARTQQEKILAQSMILLQTNLNSLSEQYPYIDTEKYKDNDFNQWYTQFLYLKDNNGGKISISGTGNCPESHCAIVVTSGNEQTYLTHTGLINAEHIGFKILPIASYEESQYEKNFDRNYISQPWFWILGKIANRLWTGESSKVHYNLQHFVNLQYNDTLFDK